MIRGTVTISEPITNRSDGVKEAITQAFYFLSRESMLKVVNATLTYTYPRNTEQVNIRLSLKSKD